LIEWFLDELKMDPNVQDSNGDTALHDASRFGHTEVVKALLAEGAEKNIKNSKGKTASDVAKDYEKMEVVAQLA
jgi:ankyrin repeat protein